MGAGTLRNFRRISPREAWGGRYRPAGPEMPPGRGRIISRPREQASQKCLCSPKPKPHQSEGSEHDQCTSRPFTTSPISCMEGNITSSRIALRLRHYALHPAVTETPNWPDACDERYINRKPPIDSPNHVCLRKQGILISRKSIYRQAPARLVFI